MIRWLMLLLPVIALRAAEGEAPACATRIAALDAEILAAAAPTALIAERRRQVERLMRSDPRAAAALRSPEALRARIAASDPDAIERPVRRRGRLILIVGCNAKPDEPHDHADDTTTTLLQDGEQQIEIVIAPDDRQFMQTEVEIEGIELGDLLAGAVRPLVEGGAPR